MVKRKSSWQRSPFFSSYPSPAKPAFGSVGNLQRLVTGFLRRFDAAAEASLNAVASESASDLNLLLIQ